MWKRILGNSNLANSIQFSVLFSVQCSVCHSLGGKIERVERHTLSVNANIQLQSVSGHVYLFSGPTCWGEHMSGRGQGRMSNESKAWLWRMCTGLLGRGLATQPGKL